MSVPDPCVAQVHRHPIQGWSTVTRNLAPERAASFLTLMLLDAGVPQEKLARAKALLIEGRELRGTNGCTFRLSAPEPWVES